MVEEKRHMSVVARLPSVISGLRPCEVCHIRYGDPSRRKPPTGMGQKPHAKWVLPLTPDEHRLSKEAQHNQNERAWWASHGIDPIAVCERLWAVWEKTSSMVEAEALMESIILRAFAFRM